MKRQLLLVLLLLVTTFQGFSQTKGISYQAVILNPEAQQIPGVNAQNNILANSAVAIQFTIVNASGTEEYQEQHTTQTDKYGMINLLIGTGTPTGTTNFSEIYWNGTIKKLKVAIDFSIGNNFSPLSEQSLTYMPQPATQETTQLIVDNAAAIIAEANRARLAEVANSDAISTIEGEQTTQNSAIALNTAKETNITHPLVETAVPVGALFTDTQLTDAQVASAALSEGFVTGEHTVDTNTQLTETQVDDYANNNGYLTTHQDLTGLEPRITTKNSAFNKDFGTIAGTVLEGDTVTISAQQSSDIAANSLKKGQTPGTSRGDMQYWNGSAWVVIATILNEGATLKMISGVPTWVSPCFNDPFSQGDGWFFTEYGKLMSTYPNWATECEVGLLLSSTPETGGMPLFFDAFDIEQEIAYYFSNGITISPSCLLNSKNRSPSYCDNFYFTETLSGIDGNSSFNTPSGSGIVVIRASGIRQTFNITIPGSFSNILWKNSGIDCIYNITYNPNTTTIKNSPGGLGIIVNLIVDTNL